MRSPNDSTPSRWNAFSPEFLGRLDERDEPPSAAEADTAGPWKLEPCPHGGFAILRQGDSLRRGDRPAGTFERRETALLAAAILPAIGRDPLFRLSGEETAAGFPLERAAGEVVGHLEFYDPDAANALHIAESLVRSPDALARLLEAAGKVALERAGKIAFERVE